MALNVGVDLSQRRVRVRLVPCFRGQIKDGHLPLERIHIQMKDPSRRFRFAQIRDPRHVAIDNQDDIGRRDAIVDSVLQSQTGPMIIRKTHVRTSRIQHP